MACIFNNIVPPRHLSRIHKEMIVIPRVCFSLIQHGICFSPQISRQSQGRSFNLTNIPWKWMQASGTFCAKFFSTGQVLASNSACREPAFPILAESQHFVKSMELWKISRKEIGPGPARRIADVVVTRHEFRHNHDFVLGVVAQNQSTCEANDSRAILPLTIGS